MNVFLRKYKFSNLQIEEPFIGITEDFEECANQVTSSVVDIFHGIDYENVRLQTDNSCMK